MGGISEHEGAAARLIINPNAGRGSGDDAQAALIERLRVRWPSIEAVVASSGADAEALARDAARDGVPTLIVLGGDGTLNAVLNGVASIDGALGRTTFGVLPGGTGNDFAGSIGFAPPIEDAVALLLESDERAIDLGVLDDRIFVNVSAGGLFAEASEAVTPEAKSLVGRLAYLVAGSRALVDHEDVALEVFANTPDGPLTWEGRVTMFAVCNAPTAGGGQSFAPLARIDDGWLDAFVVQEASPLGLARVLLRMSGGTHLDDERVVGFRASQLQFRFARPTHVNADGEIDVRETARYSILPRATRVLMPRGHASAVGEP